VTGFAADRFGRKQPLIIGLIIFAASFALIGFAMTPNSALVYYIATGIGWGALFVVFLTVPGDLSVSSNREKYYALGTILPIVILAGIASIPIKDLLSVVAVSPLLIVLSFILFLSIIPILRAEETLSEGEIRARKMKEYVDKVGKLRKESEKK
jgi:MFS family permease